MRLETDALSKVSLLNLTVLAPESVAAGWKQCEHELRAAAWFQSKLKNFTPSTLKFSVLGPMIPKGDAYSS